MKTVAIIIPAYDCAEYIIACAESVIHQKKCLSWNYEIRIGVDGCQKTNTILKKHYSSFYYSPQNIGAYLMRNSLMYLAPADTYALFDADDTMMPEYLSRSLAQIESGADAVMTAKIQCDKNLKHIPGGGNCIEAGGAITFTHHALEAVGGFYRHRCAGDTDFMHRLKMAGIDIVKIHEPLYYRRRHPNSLTKKTDTGMGSPYRKKVWAEMCANRENGIIKIKPTIVKLEKIV